jgi:benzoyl-CoA reductase/2-hydroxyglutaryl-CoA dehydratase subunit BcrC/BadD/HgdB
MIHDLSPITLEQWDARYDSLRRAGLREPGYGGPLRRHVEEGGDLRLTRLVFDPSAAALRLWNFLLSEEDRLREARAEGKLLLGTMKDLGTVPVLAFCYPNVVAFYPDGAWWIPCVMETNSTLLEIADSLGIDESFCPVRAMLGAFVSEAHFPLPDLLTCSVGATCDDFSAIAQRLEGLGHPILWWEMPHRRLPAPSDSAVALPGIFSAPSDQVDFVEGEFTRIRAAIDGLSGAQLTDDALSQGIEKANRVRALLDRLRQVVFTADPCPLPALEMLIAEMLAIHFCSDREETIQVLEELLAEVERRVAQSAGVLGEGAVRVFWVNPVADLRAMNLLERCGGRICGTEYLFSHALDPIPTDVPPMQALARTALADPMVGSAAQRAARICHDIERFGAEAVLVSRIPGASHCAVEGWVIAQAVRKRFDIPIVELEVPPIADSGMPTLRTRIEALVEIVMERRRT